MTPTRTLARRLERFRRAVADEARETCAGTAELTRSIRTRRAVPAWRAGLASVAAVAAGNGIVLGSRSIGGAWGEAFTFVSVLVVAGVSTAIMRSRFSQVDLGLVEPRDIRGRVRRFVRFAAVLAIASVLVAAWRSTGSTDWKVAAPMVLMGRVALGTALGEELLHRGVLLTLWAATGLKPRTVLAANAVTFAFWHLAAAFEHGSAWPLHLLIPAVGALVFCWGRVRTGSILVPWLFHAATNAPGTAWGEVHL